MTKSFDEYQKSDNAICMNNDYNRMIYEAGQQSLQAEIDLLQKRIDDAVALLEYNKYVDSPLQALEVLKGGAND